MMKKESFDEFQQRLNKRSGICPENIPGKENVKSRGPGNRNPEGGDGESAAMNPAFKTMRRKRIEIGFYLGLDSNRVQPRATDPGF